MNKNLLITLWYADGLHGGVKYSAELGNFFHSLGYNVYLCGVVTNDFAKEFFAKNNVTLVNVTDFPMDISFDLVWAHHWPILPHLINRGLKYKRIINSCISHTVLVERPIWFGDNIDLYLMLSKEALSAITSNHDIPKDKIRLLPNTAPDYFFEYKFAPRGKLQCIAVVSNHPPREIMDAAEILKSRGYNVVIYGLQTKSVDITPEILAAHDVIVTIGKTVQYSLAMGIPVYNYDHFGGSGYITPQNIDEEEDFNFAGRSHRTKKSGEQIANEIIHEFPAVSQHRTELKNIADSRYRLSTQINAILTELQSMPAVPHVKITKSNRLIFDYCDMVIENAILQNYARDRVKKHKKEKPLQRLWRHIRTLS